MDGVAVTYLIGLDYGTESARGVLIDTATGDQVDSRTHKYRHGVMDQCLPDGTPLPRAWALQNATDFTEAAEDILSALGRGRVIESIGVDFTASSPMPAVLDGMPLSEIHPNEPHAYVKLWKHGAAHSYAEEINGKGGAFLDNFGGKVSAEWLLAKAAQIADEAPSVWADTGRFIEAGDWLVWQLTGVEVRSLGFAVYKAQYDEKSGYPADIVPGLGERLAVPHPIGSPAGGLSDAWRTRTGIDGPAVVAVAAIDSHAVLPAVGGVTNGCFVGALGTSAVYLFLSENFRPLPWGIEGVAKDGSVRGFWCYEAGQSGFGDMLAWFVGTFPRGTDAAESFRIYNREAADLEPGESHLVALDWWSGNRVPLADTGLSGLLLGLTTRTTAGEIYRSLIESLCFGARTVIDLFEEGGLAIDNVILTSGLALNNPLLVQIMADVLGRSVEVPQIENATAVGAAIHGAVAGGIVPDYGEGAARFGARDFRCYRPRAETAAVYNALYRNYRALCADETARNAMHELNRIGSFDEGYRS
jgi:L-ribulokinase